VLFEYTGNRPEVEARGATLGAVLLDLDRRHPGLRFRIVDEQDRIRPHMSVFVGGRRARDLRARVGADDEVHILQALSGG
jgi:hypothetical protein